MAIHLTDEEWASFTLCDKEGVEAVLTRIVAASVEDALRVLPTVVQSLVAQVATIKEASDKFYADNKDLVQHKQGVATIIEELEAKRPGRAYADLLKDAAVEARSRLSRLGSLDYGKGKPSLDSLDDSLTNMFEAKQ